MPSSIHITDSELLALIGFTTPEERAVILSLAREQGINIRTLLRRAVQEYQWLESPVFPIIDQL